ncbi:hypothetical protein WN944_019999 [Citrus x changshan-huyou]|uniref:Pentatricopeptide repeat-containing protein n=1 Tax=Citrus x changshan-huyou TaxID=2935761 RepID=A0AAP0M2N7_9ROSI
MLMNVKNDGLKPDVYTSTAVMDGFCKVGRSNEAMELLNEAIERGVTPNVVTLIHLHNVIDIGHIPRTITFNNVIQALCGVGKIDKALLLLFLMYEHAWLDNAARGDSRLGSISRGINVRLGLLAGRSVKIGDNAQLPHVWGLFVK